MEKNEKELLRQLILGSVPSKKKDREIKDWKENVMQVKDLRPGMKIIAAVCTGLDRWGSHSWAPFLGEIIIQEGKNWMVGSILRYNKKLVPCERTKYGPKTKIRREMKILGWKDENKSQNK
jgi:hypothetical protein